MQATIEKLQKQTQLARGASKQEKERAALLRNLLQPAKKIRTSVKKLHRAAGKLEMVCACRNRLCERAVEWVDAVILLENDQELAYPPLLGTGGGEGRLEYTNAFMGCLVDLLLSPEAKASRRDFAPQRLVR